MWVTRESYVGHIQIILWVSGSNGSTGMTHFQPWFRAHLMDLKDADKCIIEAGGVVDATCQKYICCLFVTAPQMLSI